MEIEGLVLSALPFEERSTILTLFTPHALCKLFVKGGRRLDPHHQALIEPFTVALYTYQQRKNDLHYFLEGSIIDQNLGLRLRLTAFEAAQQILQAIYTTQWQNKEVSALYLLTKKFLGAIINHREPQALVAPFLIKLLKYEGVLDPQSFKEPKLIERLCAIRKLEALNCLPSDGALLQEVLEYYRSVM